MLILALFLALAMGISAGRSVDLASMGSGVEPDVI